ncbi:SARP family transcriptional regulator [Acrocarpospora corrugata]|uniref:SARP family transcriptional regulator n=1 Tax=Acrocarpospora corrugata TaxID=35763 RepID=A0A5M3WFB4_9ACTN|nr:SARP family transcriptional regulator [Acrocarpospora corrugata]
MLGPLDVTHDGQNVFIGAAHKPRLVLAVLLSRSGQTVSIDRLINAVWGDSPPTSARQNIHLYVHQLRRAIGARWITRQTSGYTITAGDHLDAVRFRDLTSEGSRALADGDPELADGILSTALNLWRGPAFAEFGDCELIAEEALQLDQLRLITYEQWAEAELLLGRNRDLIVPLAELAQAHPYREGLQAHLMVALNRSGRQAEALEVFRQTRALLSEQLGIEPGPTLQRLHQDILRGDARLVTPEPAVPVTIRDADPVRAYSPLPVPRELPANIPGFIGREDALEALDAMAPDGAEDGADPVAISVITGTAGVGKTGLVLRWAHRMADRFPDGQLYLNLQGYSPGTPVRPREALAGFLRALGMSPDQVPVEATEAAARYRSLMAGRRFLVVLDNASSADQVRPLLPGNPGCAVLVTSRERLTGLVAREGAQRITLDVLIPAEAEALLAHLIGAERARAEPAALTELAVVCAYLPLALRIAAAHLLDRPDYSIAKYAEDLRAGNPLTALRIEGDEETAVSAAFDLSYRTLPASVQRVFRRLGVVACHDFTPNSAAALADLSVPEAASALDRLSRVHLVDQHRPGRFNLHDLLRRYASDRSDTEDGEEDRTQARDKLFDWYLSMVTTAAKVLYPGMLQLQVPSQAPQHVDIDTPAAARAWLDDEHHNLIAAIGHAVRHGPRPMAWLLADRLRGHHNFSRNMVDWLTAARAALAAAYAEKDERALAASLLNLAHAYYCLARYDRAINYLIRAITLSGRSGWTEGEVSALHNLSTTLMVVGRPEEASRHLSRALELYSLLGSQQGRAKLLNNLANACRQSGRLREGLTYAIQALTLTRETSAPRDEAVAITTMGELYHQLGRLDDSADTLTIALARHQELGDRYLEADTLAWLAMVHCDAGRLDQARSSAQTALEIARDIGDRFTEAQALNTLASIKIYTGHFDDSVHLHSTALRIAEEINAHTPWGEALLGLGVAHQHTGELTAAMGYAEQALKLANHPHFSVIEGRALTLFAYIHHGQGLFTEASRYGVLALENHRETGYRIGEAHTEAILARISRDPTEAEPHRQLAIRLYREIGAPVPKELRRA